MEYVYRNANIINNKNDLELLHSFKRFPVFAGCCLNTENYLFNDIDFYISKSTGIIQLNPLLPLDVVYGSSHSSGLIGSSWSNHHKVFAEYISKHDPISVFEIGGAHGILSTEYNKINKINWIIVDPNPDPIKECTAKIVKGFFNKNAFENKNSYHILHSHVLEHMYDPGEFLKQLADSMHIGQKMIFSMPNMKAMLDKKHANCLNFEHTVFLTDDYVDYLLSLSGFDITDKEYYLDDHSIFYSTVYSGEIKNKTLGNELYSKNKELFLNYILFYENLIKELNESITAPIFLFGAHVSSQLLIFMGLDTSRIISILDNDTRKQEKYLYGTSIMVNSPFILKDMQEPIVLLRSGVHNNSIKEGILNNINPTTKFI